MVLRPVFVYEDFYSRPCGRGDLRDFPVFHVGIAISTHAPAGGATIGPHSFRKVYAVISTHAPAGGATAALHVPAAFLTKFLLTPLRGGRPCPLRHRCSRFPISTHAPAGGATTMNFADPC